MKKTSQIVLSFLALSGCAVPSGQSGSVQSSRPPSSFVGNGEYPVLIFQGPSAWLSEVDSLANILIQHGVTYREVDSPGLDAMSLEELEKYSMLIIPGGDAPTMTASLTAATHARLRSAVQEHGLNYLGFCAGAWLAVGPAPEPGKDMTYGIGLVDLPFEEQTVFFKQGKEFTITRAAFPDGSRRNLLWYGGPITPDIPGGVIAKYPDGKPAITQIRSGQGFVIVSGLHPTATQPILNVLGLSDPQAIAPDFAWALIEAARHQAPLPSF